MIVFNNWIISVSGLLAMQYDNLSRSLDVVGNIPDGYKWEMLVEADEYKDTIALKRTETGLSAVLTADNLSVAGMYGFQLRATLEADGVTQRHTNVVFAAVPASLTGDGNWPEIPTAYQQYREDMVTLASHPPIPGTNGYWLIWSLDFGVYEKSTFPLPSGLAAEVDGENLIL